MMRRLVGHFDLAENLRLAQHHGIQSGGDPQNMAHRPPLGMLVKIRPQIRDAQRVVMAQPLYHLPAVVIFQATVQFGAITSGQNGGFMDAAMPAAAEKGVRKLRQAEEEQEGGEQRSRDLVSEERIFHERPTCLPVLGDC